MSCSKCKQTANDSCATEVSALVNQSKVVRKVSNVGIPAIDDVTRMVDWVAYQGAPWYSDE